MAIEVGTAYVDIVPSAAGFARRVRDELTGTETIAAAAGTRAGDAFSSGFTAKLSTALKWAAIGFGTLTTAAVGFGLKTASSNEQATVAFDTMLGSAEKAGAFLTQLRDFAAKTPFEFPELQQAAASLTSVGISADKVIPIMTSLGNATAGMGTGAQGVQRATVALQQMNAAGRISAEDLNQLRDAGVPVFELLTAATGKTTAQIAEMAANGKLGRQELEQLMTALETGKGLERFNGLMEAQSHTLAGLVSTLKDTLGQGLAAAVEPSIGPLKEMLDTTNGSLQPLLVGLGTLVASVIRPMVPLFEKLSPPVAKFAQALAEGLGAALDAILPALGDLLDALAPLLDPFAELLKAVGGPLARALAHLLRALVPIIEPLVRLTVILVDRLGVPVIEAIASAVEWLSRGLATVATAVGRVLDAGIEALVGWFERLGANPSQGFAEALGFFAQLPGRIVAAVGALGRWLWDSVFVPAAEFIGANMGGWLDTVGSFFAQLPGRIGAAVGDIGSWLWDHVIDPARNVIEANWPAWRGKITALFGELPAKLAEAIEHTKKLGAYLWDNVFVPAQDYIVAHAPDWLAAVGKAFASLPDELRAEIERDETLGAWLWDHVFQPAADEITRRAPAWKAQVAQAFADLPAVFTRGLANLTDIADRLWNTIFVPVADRIAREGPGLLTQALGVVVAASATGLNWILGLPGQIIAGVWDGLAGFPLKLTGMLATALGAAAPAIAQLFRSVGHLASDVLSGIEEILANLGAGLIDDVFMPAARWVRDHLGGVLAAMAAPFSALPDAVRDAASGMVRPFKDALNALVDTWNDFRRQLGPFGGPLPELPHFDTRAAGGPVRAYQPVIVGEAGPELWWPDVAGRIVPTTTMNVTANPAPADSGGVRIDSLSITGATQPAETAYALRSELRWLSLVARNT